MKIPVLTASHGMAARAPAFLMAVVLGGLLTLARLLLSESLGAQAPFLLAWLGMMLAAFIGGFGPAMIVTVIGFWVGQQVIVAAGKPPMGVGAAIVFGAFGFIFALAGETRLRLLKRAKAHAERLAEMQAHMVQVARLNALGEMAGSLAHELNQPLTAVGNYVNAAKELLRRDPGQAERVVQLLDKASDQTVRAGQIITRIRANVNRGEIEPSPQSLSTMIQEAVEIATSGAAKVKPAIRYDFDRAADLALADRIQVQQVVLNLVRNALEAMAATSRPELRIGTCAGDDDLVDAYVADVGPGIAPNVAERLFQPFVTDKPGGMGVGLSISRNIIEAHGGRLWADANPEGGATFRFSLKRAPLADAV